MNTYQKKQQKRQKPCRFFADGRCFEGESCEFSHKVCQKDVLGCCGWGDRCCFVHLRGLKKNNNNNKESFLSGRWELNGMVIKIENNRIEYEGNSYELEQLSKTIYYNEDKNGWWYYLVCNNGDLERVEYYTGNSGRAHKIKEEFLRVLFHWEARDGNEVSVEKEEVVRLVRESSEEWWFVERITREGSGHVPSSYVKAIQ